MPRERTVAIIAYEGASAFSVYGSYDEFRGVDRIWPYFQGDLRESGSFRSEVVTVHDAPVAAAGGAIITPTAPIGAESRYDIVYVPSMFCDARLDNADHGPLAAPRFEPEVTAFIADQWRRGALVCGICTGVFVMAEAGVLDGRKATTHWAFADLLKANFPEIDVEADHPIIASGPQDRIVTGGSTAYSSNVMLYLMSRFAGADAAHDYARASGFFCNSSPQKLVTRYLGETRIADAVVADAIRWMADNLGADAPVTMAAARANLTEKTFTRRFRQATGEPPLKHLQRIRIEEARRLLEKGRAPVEEIAVRVGYAEAGAFRRIFKREVGMTPAEYRRSFTLPAAARDDKGAVAASGAA